MKNLNLRSCTSKLYTRPILLIYVFNNHILIYDYVFLKYLKRKIIDEFIVS